MVDETPTDTSLCGGAIGPKANSKFVFGPAMISWVILGLMLDRIEIMGIATVAAAIAICVYVWWFL
jgi:hypothetical protein